MVTLSGDLLLCYSWFSPLGLDVYGIDGSMRFHTLESPVQAVQAGGGMAFLSMPNGTSWDLGVVDLSSGQVVTVKRANVLLVG